MKTVFLVRHAKSSWKEENLIDLDRPLRPKGIVDASRSASKMADKGAYPDLIISSPAIRSIHTALVFARQFDIPVHRIQMNDALYEAQKASIVEVIENLQNELDSIMLVGHDPSLTNFANEFMIKSKEKLPTSSVLCLKFKVDKWKQIKGTQSKLSFYISPVNKR